MDIYKDVKRFKVQGSRLKKAKTLLLRNFVSIVLIVALDLMDEVEYLKL